MKLLLLLLPLLDGIRDKPLAAAVHDFDLGEYMYQSLGLFTTSQYDEFNPTLRVETLRENRVRTITVTPEWLDGYSPYSMEFDTCGRCTAIDRPLNKDRYSYTYNEALYSLGLLRVSQVCCSESLGDTIFYVLRYDSAGRPVQIEREIRQHSFLFAHHRGVNLVPLTISYHDSLHYSFATITETDIFYNEMTWEMDTSNVITKLCYDRKRGTFDIAGKPAVRQRKSPGDFPYYEYAGEYSPLDTITITSAPPDIYGNMLPASTYRSYFSSLFTPLRLVRDQNGKLLFIESTAYGPSAQFTYGPGDLPLNAIHRMRQYPGWQNALVFSYEYY